MRDLVAISGGSTNLSAVMIFNRKQRGVRLTHDLVIQVKSLERQRLVDSSEYAIRVNSRVHHDLAKSGLKVLAVAELVFNAQLVVKVQAGSDGLVIGTLQPLSNEGLDIVKHVELTGEDEEVVKGLSGHVAVTGPLGVAVSDGRSTRKASSWTSEALMRHSALSSSFSLGA